MGIPIEELNRASLVETGGELRKVSNGATDVRATAKKRGRANLLGDDPGPVAKLERIAGDGALGEVQTKGRNSGRFLIRVVSIRKRLLDEDNLAEKYHVDCCRYAGVLPKDSPGTAHIEVSQQKADKGAAEEVRIEIYRAG
jgi:hypothetical protein